MTADKTISADHFLDISDEVCPMSFVLTKVALDDLKDGQTLDIICKVGDPIRNISMQLKEEGHLITDVKKQGDTHFRLTVVKGGLE
jgi:TusA-related sulfurtransferase